MIDDKPETTTVASKLEKINDKATPEKNDEAGLENIKKAGFETIEKPGLETIEKVGFETIEKAGLETIEKVGLEAIEKPSPKANGKPSPEATGKDSLETSDKAVDKDTTDSAKPSNAPQIIEISATIHQVRPKLFLYLDKIKVNLPNFWDIALPTEYPIVLLFVSSAEN